MTELFILFLAAVIQAYAGFGYAIFSIPLLMLLLGRDYQSAVVVCNVTFLLQSGIMTASVLRKIRVIDVLTVGLLVPAGAWIANTTLFTEMQQPWIRAAFVCAFGAYLIYIAQKFLNHWPTQKTPASPGSDTTVIASRATDASDGHTQKGSMESQPVSSRLLNYWMSLLAGLATGAVGVVSGPSHVDSVSVQGLL